MNIDVKPAAPRTYSLLIERDVDVRMRDGARLKALDGSALAALGWKSRTDFRQALAETYQWFLQHTTPVSLTRQGGSLARASG